MRPNIDDLAGFIRQNTELACNFCQSLRLQSTQYQFAGIPLDVFYTSEGLFEVVDPVIAHARQASAKSGTRSANEASVFAIDSAAMNLPPPPSSWPFPDETQQDHQRICWQPENGLALSSDDSRGIWHLWDMSKQCGVYWLAGTSVLPYWEYASPLRHFIHWSCLEHGVAMIHSAAIGKNGQGVLLTGQGGSGKSTLTAAAVAAGWQTVGDDFTLLRIEPGKVFAYPIYDILKLTGMAEELFADLLQNAINPDRTVSEKAMVRLSDIAEDNFVECLEVNAIFSQSLSHEATSKIGSITKVDAVSALAPSTMNILRTAMPTTLRDCSRLAKALPTYSLSVGTDPYGALTVLENWMKAELHHG